MNCYIFFLTVHTLILLSVALSINSLTKFSYSITVPILRQKFTDSHIFFTLFFEYFNKLPKKHFWQSILLNRFQPRHYISFTV